MLDAGQDWHDLLRIACATGITVSNLVALVALAHPGQRTSQRPSQRPDTYAPHRLRNPSIVPPRGSSIPTLPQSLASAWADLVALGLGVAS